MSRTSSMLMTLATAWVVLWSGRLIASGEIGRGSFSVEISDHGVLSRIPDVGIRTVDGPRVELGDGFAEWFGISYEGPSGRVEAVGLGGSADWAGRRAVQALDFSATKETATAISRAGELEIRTHFSFDDSGLHLLGKVVLANRGTGTLKDLVYTREWRGPAGPGWTFPDSIGDVRPAADRVRRHAWSLGALPPGSSTGLRFSYRSSGETRDAATVDVPLSLWADENFPGGLPVGVNLGISWGDFDADGHADLFVCHCAHLWRNVGGLTWEFAQDLDIVLPPTERRYGSSFGDYNKDGRPDIGTEPRIPIWGDDRMHLLRAQEEVPYFVDVATDPAIVDVQPYGNSETFCWGDVDCDGNLDLFVPVYPPWEGGPGNFFLHNLGPTGPGGAYRFTEISAAAGLDNPPPDTARPEGAQFVDVDFDGDIDLYSNGTLYQNVSSPGTPRFDAMNESASGIGLSTSLDEGAMLFDYDLDGDPDLFVVYTADGVRIWENYGDGTFFEADQEIMDSPMIGLNLGMSAEDWDNDGDVDFTTRQVFRRNMLVEEGARHFIVATHSIPPDHLSSALPAWGDWDRDGDLDCALGNWGLEGHFYENTSYTPQTPQADRRHLRVRVVGDSPAVASGLEVEYGAAVELHVLNGPDSFRRRKFVASSHGYLNQNEYTLHFGLPGDPAVADPEEDLHFDLTVDFPSLPEDGGWRVDRHVNPALGDINLAELAERQIEIYRCGRAVIGGVVHDPIPLASPRLTTTTDGLGLATATAPLVPPTTAPGADWFTGLAFDTLGATESVRVKEILLDGQLDTPVACGGDTFNIAVWDVTDAMQPFIVAGGALARSTSPRNRRSYFRTDVVLDPGRSYRLAARVTELRGTSIDAPVDEGPITVVGGLDYEDLDPCSGAEVAVVQADPKTTALALRFGPVASSTELDPIGDTLRLGKDTSKRPVLTWVNANAAGYRVLRCDAGSGSCTPTLHATSPVNEFTDDDVSPEPGEVLWYRTKAVNECTAGL